MDAFTDGVGETAKREKYVVRALDYFQILIDILRAAIRDVGAERVVVDSVTTLYITKPALVRSMVL